MKAGPTAATMKPPALSVPSLLYPLGAVDAVPCPGDLVAPRVPASLQQAAPSGWRPSSS